MEGSVDWRPGVGRSQRSDRIPVDLRALGRTVPTMPLSVPMGMSGGLTLRQLHTCFEQGRACIEAHVPELVDALQMSNGHYPELLAALFGGNQRELLAPGTYIITDSTAEQRVLYIGSSVDGAMRSRLIAHVYEKGRVYLARQAYRDAVASVRSRAWSDARSAEFTLRHALFGANRWADGHGQRCHDQARAVSLVSYGAFDIAAIRVPVGRQLVARLLERFLVEVYLRQAQALPPLNAYRVIVEREPRMRGQFDARTLNRLLRALDDLAQRIGESQAPVAHRDAAHKN